jgi:RimJ/RimL family protein N-acetyltransferase
MTKSPERTLPRRVACEGGEVELRFLTRADADAVLAFARKLPTHDLLFLPRDISEPKVLAAWIDESERGAMTSILALLDGCVVGCAAIVRDPLSWSPHVGELRIVVSNEMRGRGVGRALIQESFVFALGLGMEKIVAQMTVDQQGAIALFEGLGFRAEALMRGHVKGRDGVKHDIVLLGHDVAEVQSKLDAYGVTRAV